MKRGSSIVFLIFSLGCFGQFENVQIPATNGPGYRFAQCEPAIAINPQNPKQISAAALMSQYYYSKNGGKSWKSKRIESKYGVAGDPVLMYDMEGRVYYFHLANYAETQRLDRIVCQSAKKLCSKFDPGTSPKPNGAKVQDKHWTVVNPLNNEIYMTWTQFDAYNSNKPADSSIIVFSKSTDQGKTWSDPMRISKHAGDCLDGDNTVEGAVPAVGPNGEIYVAWTGPKGLVFQRSLDGGETWLSEEIHVDLQHQGWALDVPGFYRANGLPILKCDLSDGPNRGTLYLNWCDQMNGTDDTDVWIVKSTDGGKTWSDRIRVNQDKPGKHQFFTWPAIDSSNGYIYIVYYDRRNYDDTQTDVYLSFSRDGGETFNDTLVSEKPFTPDDEVFFGDYLNIDAVNGIIRPIWPRMDNRKISLWVALIEENMLEK